MICERCKKEITLNDNQIQDRKNLGLKENLCGRCYSTVKQLKTKNFPEELFYIKGDKQYPLSYDIYFKYKEYFSEFSKQYVKYVCKKCNTTEIKQVRQLKARQHFKDESICNSCISVRINQSRPKKPPKPRKRLQKPKTNEENIIRKVFKIKNSLCGLYKGVFFSNTTELNFLYEHINTKNCTLFTSYQYKNETYYYRPNIIMDKKIIEVYAAKPLDYNERCFAGMQLAKRNNLKYKVIFKEDIYTDFRSNDDIKIIPQKDLIIFNYPVSWRQDKFYYKNHDIFQTIYNKFKCISDRDEAFKNIWFYLREKKRVKQFQNMNDDMFFTEYDKIIQSNQFILYHILKEKYNEIKGEIIS